MALARITKEKDALKKDLPPGLIVEPSNTDAFEWSATIPGPEESPYEGGTFQLKILFPSDYPSKPPKITFKTNIYHPNVDNDGNIDLDILQEADKWSPKLTAARLLLSIPYLLLSPDLEKPLVPDIAKLYETNLAEYEAKAKESTKKYAT